MGLPLAGSRTFPGNRLELIRASMMAAIFMVSVTFLGEAVDGVLRAATARVSRRGISPP